MRKLIAAILIFVASVGLGLAQTPVPAAISYQGLINDPVTNEPAADGPHTVKFTFYDAPVAGNFKWETASIGVTTFKGLFATIIPIPESATWSQSLYVELTVDGVEMPRIQLTTVPYAFRSSVSDVAASMDAGGLTGAVSDQRLSAHLQDLADGELSGSKIGGGIKASNITGSGSIPNTVLDDDLQDLADGELSGAKIGVGIKATAITNATAGSIPNAVLDTNLQDLADGSLTGSKVGEGINAANITVGTLPTSVLPASTVAGSGTVGQLAHWSAANQLSSDGLYWDSNQNELGIGTADPQATVQLVHGADQPTATAMIINNSWNQAQMKTGLALNMTSNANAATQGINLTVEASGNGSRHGILNSVSSAAGNTELIIGIESASLGSGSGDHVGIYGKAQSSGNGTMTAVAGEASGTGSGQQIGVAGSVTSNQNTTMYGVRGTTTSTGLGAKYGVYGAAIGAAGFSTHYGVYGHAEGGVKNWGVFSNGNLYVNGEIHHTGMIKDVSDRKLKKNILPITSALEKILSLKPSTYFFRIDEFPSMNLSRGKRFGLIAQEVEKVFPELVGENVIPSQPSEDGKTTAEISYKNIDYISLIPVLIKGMQEQQTIIENQQKSIDSMRAEIEKLSAASNKTSTPRIVKTSSKK